MNNKNRRQSMVKIQTKSLISTQQWRLTLYIRDLSTKNFENRLPFELQCWSTTHFEGFVELSALLLYLERFGGNKHGLIGAN